MNEIRLGGKLVHSCKLSKIVTCHVTREDNGTRREVNIIFMLLYM